MRGRLTMRACAGLASGTWITSMLKSAVSGFFLPVGARAAGQLLGRAHRAVPDPYT
jgi:hypothetical protein